MMNKKIYKVVDASFQAKVMCSCPYCNECIDIIDEVAEYLDRNMQVFRLNLEIECSNCEETFVLNNVTY